jgi:hypothetical protein
MPSHISTKQVVAHIKTAKGATIGGISLPLVVNENDLTIGNFVFPFDKFDIGGMSPSGMHLVDTEERYFDITFLDADGKPLPHPVWDVEAYDASRIKNTRLTNASVPVSIYVPKTSA